MKPTKFNRPFELHFIVSVLPLLAFVGCGSSNPDLKPVTGQVKYQGEPLAGATLRFIPAGDTAGFGGSGKTDAQGKYQITYVRGGEGLLPGEYKVSISKRVMPDGSAPPEDVDPIESPARETLPPRYSSDELTQFDATVRAEGATVDFDLD